MLYELIAIIIFIVVSVLAYKDQKRFWDKCVCTDLERMKSKKQNPWADKRLKCKETFPGGK